MKILIVHSIYRPFKKGGAEVVVERFIDELKKNHEAVVLTVGKQPTTNNKQQTTNFSVSVEEGVTVVRFVPFNIFSIHDIDKKPIWLRIIWHALDVWNIHSYFVMRKVLKMYQPDVVWTHTMKGIGYSPFLAIQKWRQKLPMTNDQLPMKKKWFLTPHSEEFIYQFGYGKFPFKIGIVERLTMFFTRWFTKDVDTVLAPSRQIIELHEKYGFWKKAETFSLWPCFVIKKDVPLPQPATFTFGFIGQIEEHKGIKLLIDAFKAYKNQNVKLFIAGRGNLVPWVVEQTKKHQNIEFFGEYRQDQLETLFSKISVLVVPSLIRDNMPTVILEAFAHGRPVIGSNLGGIPEIIDRHFERSASETEKSHSDLAFAYNEISPRGSRLGRDDNKTTKGFLLNGFKEKDFHGAFDEIQKPDVYQKLVENIINWKPVTIQEVLERIGL